MMKKQTKIHKSDENYRSLQAVVEQVLGVNPGAISQSNLEKRMQEVENLTEAERILYEKIISLLHVSIGFSATQWHRAQGENCIVPATPSLMSREQFYLQNLQHLTWSVGSAKQKPSTVSGRDRYTILRLPLQSTKTLAAFKGAWLSPNLVHVANEQECGSICFASCDCDSTNRQIQYRGTYQIGEKIRSQMESTYILDTSDTFSEKHAQTVRRQRFEDQVVSIENLSQFLALNVILELRYIGGHYQMEILEHLDNENLICDLIDITLHDDCYQLHSSGIFPLEPIYEIAKINSVDLRFESFLYGLSKNALDQFYSLSDEFSFGYDFDEKILRGAVEEDNAYFIKNLFKLGLPANVFLFSEDNDKYEPLICRAVTKKALKTIKLILRNNNSYFHSDFQHAPGEFLCALIENSILDAVVEKGLDAPKRSNIRFNLRYNFTNQKGYHPLIKSAECGSYAFEHIWSQTKMTPKLAGLVICKLILKFSNKHSSRLQLFNMIQRLFSLGADPNTHYWLPIKESKLDFQLHEDFGCTPLHMALESYDLTQPYLKELFELLIRNKADPYEPVLFQIHNGELGNPYTLWTRSDDLANDEDAILAELGFPRPACSLQDSFPSKLTIHLVVRLKEAESCKFLMAFCHEQHLTVNQELRLPSAQFGAMDQKSTHNTVKWICLKYHLNTLYSELMHQKLVLRELASVDDNDQEHKRRDVFFLIDLETPHLVQANLHCFYSFNELMNQRPYRVANYQIKLLSYLQNPNYIPGANEIKGCVAQHEKFQEHNEDIKKLLQGYESTYPVYGVELYQNLKKMIIFDGRSLFNLLVLYYQHLSRVLSKHALTKLLAYAYFPIYQSEIGQYLRVLDLDEKAYFLMDKHGYHQRALFKMSESLAYYHYPELGRMLNYFCCKLQLISKKRQSVVVPKSIESVSLLNQLKFLNVQIIQSGLENETKIILLSMIVEIFIHFDAYGHGSFPITQILTRMHQIANQESLTADPGIILLQQSMQLTKQLAESKFKHNCSVSISNLVRAHFINTDKSSKKRSASDEFNESDDPKSERDLYENQ